MVELPGHAAGGYDRQEILGLADPVVGDEAAAIGLEVVPEVVRRVPYSAPKGSHLGGLILSLVCQAQLAEGPSEAGLVGGQGLNWLVGSDTVLENDGELASRFDGVDLSLPV